MYNYRLVTENGFDSKESNQVENFYYLGEYSLLQQRKSVLIFPFASDKEDFHLVREWIRTQDPNAGCIVCGNITAVERYALRVLLNLGFYVIMPLATAIPQNLCEINLGLRLSEKETETMVKKALNERRLLIVAWAGNESISIPTGQTICKRDDWMIQTGNRFMTTVIEPYGYLDQKLIGCEIQVLRPLPLKEATAEEAQQMGWIIYRRLKQHDRISSVAMRHLLWRFLQLNLPRPSLLHSLVLYAVLKNYADCEDFNLLEFLKCWSIQNLRLEDWKGQRTQDGKFLPSLVERCLTKIFHRMPSRNLLSTACHYAFDTNLAHQWVDAALQRSPNNKKLLKRALQLAFYERNFTQIDYLKQQLNATAPAAS